MGEVRERIRAALERAVRMHASAVVVDRAGQARITGALEASQERAHGLNVGVWTFAPGPGETVTQDEIDYATGVLVTAWEVARRVPGPLR